MPSVPRFGCGIGAEPWSAEYGITFSNSTRLLPSPDACFDPVPRSRPEDHYTIPEGTPSFGSENEVAPTRRTVATQKERKNEASFVCPFPGCGSTLTLGIGHLRSHDAEKPFVCHWPECGKGFQRQHDCKRHEQLHTNYRPFPCEGCGRQFVRNDALNRHCQCPPSVYPEPHSSQRFWFFRPTYSALARWSRLCQSASGRKQRGG
ncbi:hypothetical protein FA13DRAFT_1628434 [Coprinellus micaceus]|uniref:C2H2-type domain-containing protein n=1 Tax=Coprinellus micaceus TaxID=71717 RepID=A0A4Y7TDM0_COPMI|nr:hypothetical protein FA13DRAFT_1628434 [Coprinellus micaceus]